jgi:hypothetical protein
VLRGYTMEFAGSTLKKKLETSNQPIRTKIFQKKYVWYLKSLKKPKIRMRATRRNLQARTKVLKKLSKHQIK